MTTGVIEVFSCVRLVKCANAALCRIKLLAKQFMLVGECGD